VGKREKSGNEEIKEEELVVSFYASDSDLLSRFVKMFKSSCITSWNCDDPSAEMRSCVEARLISEA
jgi:hypothetical protein